MPKKAGIVFVIVGTMLMVSALLLFFYNRSVDSKAGQKAQEVLTQIQAVILEETKQMETEAASGTVSEEMTVVQIDGFDYIGYLTIPKLELKLPVMSEWDYDRLQIAPCRHFGSTKTDDLVIAAHNYSKHFGNLAELEAGDSVTFTDMDGEGISYQVERLETLDPNAVDAVQYSDCDLVLYTCTYGGENRTAVFCNRIKQ